MKHGLFAIVLVCLLGCTTTKERTETLCAIARQSAQHGAQDWLREHQDHRDAFKLVADALRYQTNREPFVLLLSSLPTQTLRGPAGEVYISTNSLVVRDGRTGKPYFCDRATEQAVMRATLSGLRAALVPMPPAVPKRVAGDGTLTGRADLRYQTSAMKADYYARQTNGPNIPIPQYQTNTFPVEFHQFHSWTKTNEIHVTNIVVVHYVTQEVYRAVPPSWQQPMWTNYTNNSIPVKSPIFTPTVAVTNTTTYQPGFGHLGNAELVEFTNSAGKRAKIWRPVQPQ